MEVRFCDEDELGFGWIHPEPSWMERAGHALASGHRVWIVDPIDGDGVDDRILALGEPAGVVQLLDRHNRDCAAFARRFGVPHHRVPFEAADDMPFQIIALYDRRLWREAALWWPDQRALVCADVLGTAPHYLAPGERLATSPVLRLTPPKRLGELEPLHVLCGHGVGIHGDRTPLVLREALDTSRRRAPGWLASYLRMVLTR